MTTNSSQGAFKNLLRKQQARPFWRSFANRFLRTHLHGTLVACLLALISLSPQVHARDSQMGPPNLVFILTDDQGIDAIQPPNGTDHFPNQLDCVTPALASFASQGRIFTNFRVNPKCSPTRAGILTGRSSLRTGLVGVINKVTEPTALRDRAAVQTIEYTVAEALQARGYYTILIGKWHIGWARTPSPPAARPFTARQDPRHQGFDQYVDYRDFFCRISPDCGTVPPTCDCPFSLKDDHITWSVDMALAAVKNRPDPAQPYALFFWPVDPHIRNAPRTWWPVSDSLLEDPSRYDINSEVDRYRAVIEAVDTECRRLLEDLDIIDEKAKYNPQSDTVVIFASDNGTPAEVSFFGPDRAKGTLFEGGIRVPLFVFGENVPTDGAAVTRLVSHLDLFATLMDITGDPEPQSRNLPRESMSFADSIGWSVEQLPQREYTLSSRAPPEMAHQEIALTDGVYKLVMSAGMTSFAKLGPGVAPKGDRLYRLPNEDDNLASIQNPVYLRMREAAVEYWATAVAKATRNQIDITVTGLVTKSSRPWTFSANLIPLGVDQLAPNQIFDNRAFIRFDLETLFAELTNRGKQLEDIRTAEIIVRFAHDSILQNPVNNFNQNYFKYDGDTAAIHAYPMTRNWNKNSDWETLVEAHDSTKLLGLVDLPPHILNRIDGDRISTAPIALKTPISFGHHPELRQLIIDWGTNKINNNGIVLMGALIPELGNSFQRIQLRREDLTDIRLRVTLN